MTEFEQFQQFFRQYGAQYTAFSDTDGVQHLKLGAAQFWFGPTGIFVGVHNGKDYLWEARKATT